MVSNDFILRSVLMKNTYLTGYFPLLSIILFSLSTAVYTEIRAVAFLQESGIYAGMLEFFSDTGVKAALLVMLFVIFFMMLAALKLISDTIVELSLLFFSKDSDGEGLKSVRMGAAIYFIGGAISLVSVNSIIGITVVFLLTTLTAFIYFVFKISPNLTFAGLIGMIFFHIIIWVTLVLAVAYSAVKLYNSLIASLPI